MRIGPLRFAAALVPIVMLATVPTAFAGQHEQHPPHSVSTNTLRLDVDGKQNPERISDYIAYRQFILAAAVRDDSSGLERAHGLGVIRRIGLSANDEALLKAALRSVRERLDDVSAEKQALRGQAAPSAVAALRQREEAVFDGANRRIRAFLSNDGWRRLDQFVQQQIKPGVKVYRGASR